MPSPLTTALLAFAAVLTALSAVAGVAVAGLAIGWELALTYLATREET